MEKVDFKKELKALYSAPAGDFVVIDVPTLNYFMVDGAGNPNNAAAYAEAVDALYTVSYRSNLSTKLI